MKSGLGEVMGTLRAETEAAYGPVPEAPLVDTQGVCPAGPAVAPVPVKSKPALSYKDMLAKAKEQKGLKATGL